MAFLLSALAWLVAPEQWAPDALYSVPTRLVEHVVVAVVCVGIAAAIAVPLGCWVGHTGRGRQIVVGVTSAARAVPTLGLLVLLVMVLVDPLGSRPAQLVGCSIALAVLAIPSLLAGTYAGIESVDRVTIDAARASGMTEWQILTRVELPLAAPILIGGLRSAVLMVIATATIASFVGLGGLGAIIASGIGLNDYDLMLGASILVTILALVADGTLGLVQRAAQRARHGA